MTDNEPQREEQGAAERRTIQLHDGEQFLRAEVVSARPSRVLWIPTRETVGGLVTKGNTYEGFERVNEHPASAMYRRFRDPIQLVAGHALPRCASCDLVKGGVFYADVPYRGSEFAHEVKILCDSCFVKGTPFP